MGALQLSLCVAMRLRLAQRHGGGALLLATLLVLPPSPVRSQGDSTVAQVVRIIDGDTIEVCCLNGQPEKVRYIGVNTPKTHHRGGGPC